MKQEVKKYTVTIAGQSYSLLSDEPEREVINAALSVDRLLQEIALKASTISSVDKTVLGALTLSLRLSTLESQQEKNKELHRKLINTIESVLNCR